MFLDPIHSQKLVIAKIVAANPSPEPHLSLLPLILSSPLILSFRSSFFPRSFLPLEPLFSPHRSNLLSYPERSLSLTRFHLFKTLPSHFLITPHASKIGAVDEN